MKMTNILLLAGLSGVSWFVYQNYVAFDHPIAGSWELDPEQSMKEWYKQGVTAEQEKFIKAALSQESVLTFNKSTRSFLYNGNTDSGSYTLKDLTNNCYEITDSNTKQAKACIINGDLHWTVLPRTPKSRTEVFVKPEK